MVLNSLSGRFLMLTIVFVMLAEVLIFVPSVARFRVDFLLSRLERAQIASLALLANDGMISDDLERELLRNAGVYNVVLRRDQVRELVLSSPIPEPVYRSFDLREAGPFELIPDALRRMADPRTRVIRVIGEPVQRAGLLIEITMSTEALRQAMIDYGLRILVLSAVISLLSALLLFLAARRLLVVPIKRVVRAMQLYAEAPEDNRRIITPSARVRELHEAETALRALQEELTGALRQKERLAQLGSAVAKISHDLRNILTTAQLFADRIEASEDPAVTRAAPRIVGAISRAVHLCEATLAFGRAQEPPPRLERVALALVVNEVVDGERLAAGDDDISFSEDVPAGLTLRADAEQMHRVLTNLVRNARQAIAASGKPGEICIRAEEDDAAWIVQVTDTGPGLPPKARDHLFQPFHGGTRRDGTGLGLAISMELVRGHGGTLVLRRSDASGTAFEIRLPKAAAALATETETAATF